MPIKDSKEKSIPIQNYQMNDAEELKVKNEALKSDGNIMLSHHSNETYGTSTQKNSDLLKN